VKILVGAISFNTKIFTDIFLQTVTPALRHAKNDNPNNEFKLVVIDNGSNDGTSELIKNFRIDSDIAKYECYVSPENAGISPGFNQLIKAGFDDHGNPLYDYYLMCNNDIFLAEKSLTNFIKCLEQDKKKEFGWISMFMSDYLEPELTGVTETVHVRNTYWPLRPDANDIKDQQQMKDIIRQTYSGWGGIDKFNDLLVDKYGISLKQMHPKAPLFALSKECIKKVGLFDEDACPIGLNEDSDYCERIQRYSNFKMGAAYGSYVHHFCMMTRTRTELESAWRTAREFNFTSKWTVSSKETNLLSNSFPMKIDIGSGHNPRLDRGWYHMDVDKKWPHLEFIHDLNKPMPFEDNSIGEIFCSHQLEHIDWLNIKPVIKDLNRVLIPGSMIHIRVPNLRWIAQRYLEGSWTISFDRSTERNIIPAIYAGLEDGIPHLHKNGFDFTSMKALLEEFDFEMVREVNIGEGSFELRVEAFKKL
jgi:GT2 family glycosyltransferase